MSDRRFLNVIHLGASFFLIFAAYDTVGNVLKPLLDSVREENKYFDGDGYMALAIINIAFALSNWFAPSLIDLIGLRLSMVFGAATNIFYLVSLFFPVKWLIYLSSGAAGVGGAVLWTAGSTGVAKNSDDATMTRNSCFFLTMYQAAFFVGNLYVSYEFESIERIDYATRTRFLLSLTVVCVLGAVVISLTRKPMGEDGNHLETKTVGPVTAFKEVIAIMKNPVTQLFAVQFVYIGLILSFALGVYSPSIGSTLNIAEYPKSLIGVSGSVTAAGQIFASLSLALLNKRAERWGRAPILALGIALHLIAYLFIILNLPNEASIRDTRDPAIIRSNPILAVACSGALGLGISLSANPVYISLGIIYSDNPSAIYALYYFFMTLAGATSFFYSSYAGLYCQVGILAAVGSASAVCFYIVERRMTKQSSLSTMQLTDGIKPGGNYVEG